jgi:hypothetical protein
MTPETSPFRPAAAFLEYNFQEINEPPGVARGFVFI